MDIGLSMEISEDNIIPMLAQELDCKRKNDPPQGLVIQSTSIIFTIFF